MMSTCVIGLIFGLIMYAVFVTWRWRLAVKDAKANKTKAAKLDKIAKEFEKPR